MTRRLSLCALFKLLRNPSIRGVVGAAILCCGTVVVNVGWIIRGGIDRERIHIAAKCGCAAAHEEILSKVLKQQTQTVTDACTQEYPGRFPMIKCGIYPCCSIKGVGMF